MTEVSDRSVVVIAVAMIAILVIGEVIVYTSDSSDYSADIGMEDGVIEYDLGSRDSKVFDILVNDNNGYEAVHKLYLYLDTGYASKYSVDEADVGAAPTDQEYYLEQLVQLLEYRSDIETEFVDASQLREVMEDGVASGDCSGTGLVVVSGALPETDSPPEGPSAYGSPLYSANSFGGYSFVLNTVTSTVTRRMIPPA